MFLLRPGLISSVAALAGGGGTTVQIEITTANSAGLEVNNVDPAVTLAAAVAQAVYRLADSAYYVEWDNSGYAEQTLLEIDTSSIPGGATVTAVDLVIPGARTGGGGSNISDLQVRSGHAWVGPPAVGDWVSAAAFAALSLKGSAPVVAPLTEDELRVSLNPSAVVAGGTTQLVLALEGWASADNPQVDDGYLQISLPAIAALPYLEITYTA